MNVLAHIGGLPIQESLIYLVPPLLVVGWIYILGRRERRNPEPPEAFGEGGIDEDELHDAPIEDRGGRA